jgi:ribosomal protein S18 acetylase RimI-like enzyme
MSNFPTEFQLSTQLISDEVMADPADVAFINRLADQGYEVHAGLTDKLADQLETMALEPHIKEFCPNDCSKRFKDRLAIEEWLKKERATFLLLKHGDVGDLELAGYGWVGKGTSSHVPGGENTFAIRIGQAAQGQGLATPFARLIVAGAAVLYDAKNIWLETWESNAGAVHVYHKIGFQDVDKVADERPRTNGERISDNRLYMQLPNDLLPVS